MKLKNFFQVLAEREIVSSVLNEFPEIKVLDEVKMPENVRAIELPDEETEKCARRLAEAFERHNCSWEAWLEPETIDFANLIPLKECNSFVLVAYGNFTDTEHNAKKWSSVSKVKTGAFCPVIVSCYKDGDVSWVEFRGHNENPTPQWFEDIRKISKEFTKSNPYFYRAEKLVL